MINNNKKKTVSIHYASETGHAAQLALDFAEICSQNFHVETIHNMNEEFSLKSNSISIFFVATAGLGEFPAPMRPLWQQMLVKNYQIPPGSSFAVYALGDSSYGQNFCLSGRKLRQRLKMLGGQEIVDIGLGDDQDPEGVWDVYRKRWLPQVLSQLRDCVQKGEIVYRPYLPMPTNTKKLKIIEVTPLNTRQLRKTYLITLLYGAELDIQVGQILSIYPHNSQAVCCKCLNYFEEKADTVIDYSDKKIPLGKLLKQIINIASTVPYSFFRNRPGLLPLSAYTENAMYRQKLDQLSTDFSEYYQSIQRYRKPVLQILRDFELRLPLRDFINRCNRIWPRKYSIAKIDKTKREVSILIRLVEELRQNRRHLGLCTHDLVISLGESRQVTISKGEFNPVQSDKYAFIVGVGTGIAPLLPILESKAKQPMTLFFCNRYSDETYHHQIVSKDKLLEITEHLSFTREGGLSIIRLIQSKQQQISQAIRSFGQQNVIIYVCGPKQVTELITNLLLKLTSLSPSELKKSKMLVSESW